MTMSADGGGQTTAGKARRPTIRPRSISPPRSAAPKASGSASPVPTWTLPPPRVPALRRAAPPARPVLLLVDQDEVLDAELAVEPQRPRARGRLHALSLVVALLAVAAGATVAAQRALAGGRAPQAGSLGAVAAPERVMTTTLTSAPLERTAEPAIPVVDVKSLPTAPRLPKR